jgi:4-amino-4-deoxy-L-arabinose transferase-like glycosyltransferase
MSMVALETIKKLRKDFYEEISAHRAFYAVLFIVLVLALFIRTYRTEGLLGFYYDQGRDALVIWRLWHDGKFFLIGPVSGLAGIFLGPLYYYLIAPFYLLGRGDPRFPAFLLAFLSVLALPFLFVLAKKMHSKTGGLITVTIASFSYYLVLSGRWLSNPTPILLSSTLLLYSMYKVTEKRSQKDAWWVAIALLIGVSLQFESASAVFYLPMIVVFALWQKKNFPSVKAFLLGLLVLLLTFSPQILFNFRHGNIMVDSFERVLVQEKSFRNPLNIKNLVFKKDYFWTVFNSKIFPGFYKFSLVFYAAVILGLFKFFKRNKRAFLTLAIFLGIPILCYIFFQGNGGHIYDYYMTGYYLPMILLFSLGLATLWEKTLGKLVIIWFFAVFLYINGSYLKAYLASPVGGPVGITLETEMAATDWIYRNATAFSEFNTDVYVPPVTPHAYDYLFLWRGYKKCGESLCGFIDNAQVPILYTLYEEDISHPNRLSEWLKRQDTIGRIDEQIKFGGVTVQRRTRIE